ncbi:TetR/AcrR family transcriptional regulator [Gorillibacterium timonense]|uniref:TetR/AcrR family transcriptional regulator n=1 Tax=Gorillibacterium timonense TaxID=1689269 RepID=UPI0009E94686|nr:TetR/AcrR family transcriptional regulator [Gorillibacterium timonense]
MGVESASVPNDWFGHLVSFSKLGSSVLSEDGCTREGTRIATVDRRQQILDAAARSFSIYGYKATTMDQVAKDAKVGKGTIYTFFADKEELFRAILNEFIMQMKQIAESVLDRKLSFFENLHNVLLSMVNFRESHRLTIQLTHEMKDMGTLAAINALQQVESAIIGFIKREIEGAIAKKQIKLCDPEITAFVMLKLYIAFVSEWSETRGKLTNEEIARLFQLYLGDGLAVSNA